MFADLLPLSRLSNWSARLANTIVHAVCVKLKAPPQIITVVDVIVETLVFCLIQVVHHDDIDSGNKLWGDGAHIGFSVASSVFEYLGAAGTTVAILVKEIAPEAVAIVAGCGAVDCMVDTGTAIREYQLAKSSSLTSRQIADAS